MTETIAPEPGADPDLPDPRADSARLDGDDRMSDPGGSADVFISCSRKDIAFARLLRASLQTSGLDTSSIAGSPSRHSGAVTYAA